MSEPLTINDYAQRARATAVYPLEGPAAGLVYCALGLAGEAGEVANDTKKVLRDDGGEPTADRKKRLKKELGDVLWYWAQTCLEAGFDPEDVAHENLAKLAARKERGTIQGSGGDR